jgi:hypothetical protein
MYTIANTGAMLSFGQERSRGSAGLAAEPRCAPDSNRARDVQRPPKSLSEFQAHTTTPRGGRCFYTTNRDSTSVYYIIFSDQLAPGCFTRAGEGPIEIGCRADQCEMRERLRKVSEMLAVRPQFL